MNLDYLCAMNARSAFNRWCGFRLTSAARGQASVEMPWHEGLGEDGDQLHAGVVSAIMETSGFAGATIVGRVPAAHGAVSFVRSAMGRNFVARAVVEKAGLTTLFTRCERCVTDDGDERLVAMATTILWAQSAMAGDTVAA